MEAARKGSCRMARRAALVGCVAVLLLGCKGSGQSPAPVDPFFGRVRIEPPRTGAIGNSAADPSYAPALRPNPLRAAPGSLPSNPLPAGRQGPGAAGWAPASPATIGGTPGGNGAPGGVGAGWAPPPRQAAPNVVNSSNASIQGSQPPPSVSLPGDRIVIPSAARELAAGGAIAGSAQGQPAANAGPPVANSGTDFSAGLERSPAAGATPSAGLAGTSSWPNPVGASPAPVGGGVVSPAGNPSAAIAADRLAGRGAPGTPGALGSSSRSIPSTTPPTMSRPTVNLAAQRERIIRTLDPANGTASSRLPRPLDPSAAPLADSSGATPPNTIAPSARTGLPGQSLLSEPASASSLTTGTRFPNRVVDITELPVAPGAK